ncbi:DNA polymerase III subunit chi [Thalassotalea euphylliae]|uniref:DNA polymerase III subunit chi n=1 Tax=Thalassotalea euphylliae TaxID=1655234 RepID=UPI003629F15F
MQLHALFHVMPESASQDAHYVYACVQAAHYYRQQQKVYIYTNDQTQAHVIDELLWSFEPDSFVAHNLVGEGPRQGSPVEIGWQPPKGRRPILINLASDIPAFAGQFSQVIDFVPSEASAREQARARFRQYRQQGFTLDTVNVESSKNQQTNA